MKVQIQLINERGRPLFTGERKHKAAKHTGELVLAQEHRPDYGRAALVAQLQDTRGGLREPIVPSLVDAQVLWVKDDQIRIRGTELVDGAEYAQAWAVTMLPC